VPVIAEVAGSWAALAEGEGDLVAAARTVGLSAAVRGLPLPPAGDSAELAQRLRGELGDAAFTAAYDEGARLDRQGAVEALLAGAGLTQDDLDRLARRVEQPEQPDPPEQPDRPDA
jgi:hypothetical protein